MRRCPRKFKTCRSGLPFSPARGYPVARNATPYLGAADLGAGLGTGLGVSNTALTASPNPGIAGQPVTFTATVTGSGAMPGGTVTFLDNGAVLGTGSVNNSGVAVLSTSALVDRELHDRGPIRRRREL